MEKIDAKVASYESFIEDKLKRDLREVEVILNKKADDYKSWEELKNFVQHVQSKSVDELTTTFDFGLGIYLAAKLEQSNKLIINIGCQCYLEMYYEEADKYIDLRIKYLRKEIDFLRQQAVNIKAHIKLVLLAIGELKSNRRSSILL